jgi:DNA-binding XRE family transcriptional regulator
MKSDDAPDGFVRGNDRLERLRNDPARSPLVDALRDEMDAEDERYRASLAAVRRAADLTQAELADRLGVGQNTVSRTERRSDVLWSTLVSYLSAAGGTDITLSVTIKGQRIEVDLDARDGGRVDA